MAAAGQAIAKYNNTIGKDACSGSSELSAFKRSGVEKRRSGKEVQRSTFARFLGLFDFRLLQQNRHEADQAHALINVCC
jgi:hypothetical protein